MLLILRDAAEAAALQAEVDDSRSRLQRFFDFDLEDGVDVVGGDRADHLVDNGAFATDHEGLRHAIDTPFDRGAAVAIDADNAERIAVAAEEAPGVVGGVLVVDADELQPFVLAELGQKRRFVVARHAPRGPDIDHADLALEHGRIEPRHLRAVIDEAFQRRQRRLRRRATDQRRGDLRRIAAVQPQQENSGQRDEAEQWQRYQPTLALRRRAGCRGFAHWISAALRPERRTTPDAP